MRTAPNGWAALFSAAHKTEYKFEIATGSSGSGSSGAETEYDPETGDLTLLFDSEYDEETGDLTLLTETEYDSGDLTISGSESGSDSDATEYDSATGDLTMLVPTEYDPLTGNLTILSETEYASGNLSISGGGSSTGSTAYTARHIKSVPTITKPLMDQLSIGRCATGSLTLQIYDRPGITIPRAAEVKAYCRLTSVTGANPTDWVQIGHYYVSNRSTKGNIITLLCHDDMMKGGAPYLDHTSFIEWPQSMADVVEEIASIMGVDIDSRTVINTGAGYDVDYPDDLLMTEVLGMIAAAHGGNWIITDIGELRLVPLVTPEDGESIGTAYKSATMLALTETISRVTLTDNADNVYTAGDDTGTEITAACNYATQAIVNALGASGGSLAGVTLKPYALSGAYINPLLEPGDSVATTVNGTSTELYVASMSIKCTIGYTADLGLGAATDDEDEYPYKTARDLAAERYISMGQSYFGNRINRREGFVSEFTVNDVPVARLLANANVLSMQQMVGGEWKDRIYFDPVAGKYQISTDVVEQPYTVEITASEPLFIKAADSDSYTPASITLTANVEDTDGVTFQWQKDGTPISGATNQTLVVTADSIAGKSAVYGCTVTHDGQTSYDQTVLVKLADGRNGSNGSNGAPGTNGSDGWNTVQIYLYKRGDSAEVDWTNSLTYTFATNAIGPSIPNGWSRTIPDADGPVWVTVATASSRTASDTIAYTEWSSPVKLAQDGADGQNGLNGQNGQNGANGINTATIYLYLRSSQAVETPTGGQVYTFATHTLNELPGDWTETIPENDGSPLWVTMATAASNTATDAIDGWSTPEILAENGANGANGTNGTDGVNTATVYLYRRASSQPSKPSTSTTYTYTFSSGNLSPLPPNWSKSIPSGTDPLWITFATAVSNSATATVANWSTPVILAQNGEDGTSVKIKTSAAECTAIGDGYIDADGYLQILDTLSPKHFTNAGQIKGPPGENGRDGSDGQNGTNGINTATLYLYKRASSATVNWNTDITYTFATKEMSAIPSGWSRSIPSGSNPLWVTVATASSNEATDTIEPSDWTTPVKLAQNGSTGAKGADGTNGTNGINTATLYLYKRASSASINWTDSITYSFAEKTLSTTPSGWSRTIPSGTSPLWVTVATASSSEATDTIEYTEWTTPVKMAQNGSNGSNGTNGADGQDGAPGINTATVYLYRRSASAPTTPTAGQEYSFDTHTLTGTLPTGWSLTIPADDGNPLYVTMATAASNAETDTIDGWSAPVILAQNGEDGTSVKIKASQNACTAVGDGYIDSDGHLQILDTLSPRHFTDAGEIKGPPGLNTATVYLYIRSGAGTTPTLPSAGQTYTFATHTLTGNIGNWKTGIDQLTGSNPIWVTMATAASTEATDTIDGWSTPKIIAQDGAKGAKGDTGDTGADGKSTATLYLYKRSASKPSVDWDDDITYTFASQSLSPVPDGWSQDIVTGTDPLWVTVATAYSSDPIDTIESTDWSEPVKLVENGGSGEHGLNTATVYLYKRAASNASASTLAVPGTGKLTYHFSSQTLTGATADFNGWSQTITNDNANPIWVIIATAASTGDNDPIDGWSTPAILAKNGSDGSRGAQGEQGIPGVPGTDGYSSATVYLYKRSAAASVTVDWEEDLEYSFDDMSLASVPDGWYDSIPSGTDPIWMTAATAFSNVETDTIEPGDWATPVKIAQNGADGQNGYNVATLNLYTRSAQTPTVGFGALSYNFSNHALTGTHTGWDTDLSSLSGTDPIWVISQTVSSRSTSVTVAVNEWSAPAIMAQNGQNGQQGPQGLNTAVVYLYCRSADEPDKPEETYTYYFDSDTPLQPLDPDPAEEGWSTTIPSGTDPVWVILATAASATNSDTILSTEWSDPVILAQNGEDGTSVKIKDSESACTAVGDGYIDSSGHLLILDTLSPRHFTDAGEIKGPKGDTGATGSAGTNGYNTATIYLYQRNTQSPAVNFGSVTYRFSDRTFTSGSTGNWKSDLGQATGTDPLWVIAVTVSSRSATVSITIDKWTTPVVLAQNGAKGDPGEPGEPGTPGADGADGTDGYTIVVENDYVSIETDLEYKTKTSGEAFVIFHVYRGTSELTQINSTADLSESTFVVSAGTVKITGFTYSVNTASSRLRNRMSWSAGVSLAPMTQQEWVIRVKDGSETKTISVYTTIAASVNDVIIQRTADLIQTNTEFSSRLTRAETRFSKPINSATAPTNPTADMLWYDSTNGVLKQYDADEGAWEVVTAENARGSYAMASSLIQQFADSLELSVSTPNAVTYSKPSGVTYGFELDSDGWYVSTNGGVAASFSYFRVDFNLASSTTITISCDIGSEPNYDYGYISNLDQSLATNNDKETVANAKVYTGVQIGSYQLTIPAGAHFLTVKYRKDGSSDQNGDRFKFKISGVGGGSRLKLTSGGVELSGADITITGAVTFAEMTSAVSSAVNTLTSDLSSQNGTTVIHGSHIQTGTISASMIDTSTLKVRTVYSQPIGNAGDVPILQTNGTDVAIGNAGSSNTSNLTIWANTIAIACTNRYDSEDVLGIYTVPSVSSTIDGQRYDYSHAIIPFISYSSSGSSKYNSCDWYIGTEEYPFRRAFMYECAINDQGSGRNNNYGYFRFENGELYFTKQDVYSYTEYKVRLTEV